MREIVDAHHHLWDRSVLPYPWLKGPPFGPSVAGDVGPISASYRLEDFLADTAGYRLTGSVHIDGGCSDRLGETRWLQEMSQARGIRHILNYDPDPNITFVDRPDLMTDPAMFASNFPVDKLYSSFAVLYAAFEEIVAGFSADEQHAMFAANARRVYRLDAPST